MSKLSGRRGFKPRLHGLARGGCLLPARFFCCLKQDGQDVQDLQDERQVREDLNVYRIQQEREAKVREDLNVQRLLGSVRGTGPRATGGPQAPVGLNRLLWTRL